MENKLRLCAVCNTARCEYVKWITDPRMTVVGILLVFIRSFCIEPMQLHAEKFGVPLNAAEPFLAVCNSEMLALLMPAVYVLLICDFPVMGGSMMFFIHRTGKLNWFLGQLLFIAESIVTFLALILGGCMLMSGGILSGNWSDTVTKYDARFPEEAGGFVSRLLPPNLYNQMSLPAALMQTLLLTALFLLAAALLMCCMKMLYLRTAGLFCTAAVIAAGAALCTLRLRAMWLFPTANTMIWLHFHEILREPVTPVSRSYLYFGAVLALLLAADLTVLRKLQFINIGQEGS